MNIVIAATIVNTYRFCYFDEGGPERSELAKQSHKISQ
jgi:hypothetical protein